MLMADVASKRTALTSTFPINKEKKRVTVINSQYEFIYGLVSK